MLTLAPHDVWVAGGMPREAVYTHSVRYGHDDYYRLTYEPGRSMVHVKCEFDYYECDISARVVQLDRTQKLQLSLSDVACDIRNYWVEINNGPTTQRGGIDTLLEHLAYDNECGHSVLQEFAAAMFGGDLWKWQVDFH